MSRSPGRFAHRRVGASRGCSGGRGNMLAVGKLLLRCRLLGGARRFGANGGREERGGGISWRPPVYSLLPVALKFATSVLLSVQNNNNASHCRHFTRKALTAEQPEQAGHHGALQQPFILYRSVVNCWIVQPTCEIDPHCIEYSGFISRWYCRSRHCRQSHDTVLCYEMSVASANVFLQKLSLLSLLVAVSQAL